MKLTLLAIAAMAAAIPVAAAAQSPTAVRYSDLNLNDPQGARVMLHRIRQAAVEACRSPGQGYDTALRFEACHRQAVAEAVAKLHAPRVTAAFDVSSVREVAAR